MREDINTIIEGCYPDSPRSLMYSGIDLEIPRNANIVFSDHHSLHNTRYLLYAKTNDFSDFEVLNNPFFEYKFEINSSEFFKGGFPIKEYEPNFNWIFDDQRSLTTKDGRIYVEACYFEEGWRWYLDAVTTILRQCGEIFSGDKEEEYFNNKPNPAK